MGKGRLQGEEADSLNDVQCWPQKLHRKDSGHDGDKGDGDKADAEV